jgi:penicillin-binding protein 1A
VGSAITEVFDATGTKIATFQQFATNLPVTAADIPKVLKDAVVATEDRRFYDHRGIDPKGVVRALWADLNGGSYAQGASTIDQQYVRLVYGSNVRSLNRKLREAVLAGRVDSQLTKDQILVGYLSRVYLGGGSYGVGAAAASYFHKSVRDLTLSEAATLAGILPAPSAYDPRVDPTGADTRRIDVLAKMAAQGKITTAQESAADSQRLVLAGGDTPPGPAVTTVYPVAATATRYPWFVDYVRRYLVARFGAAVVARGGLRVETSLDPGMQAQAETAVAAALKGTQAPVDMAMVVLEPGTGLVKAMIGGRDFAASQVNTALGACPATTGPQSNDVPICIDGGGSGRQPGSAFKPFTLAKAFEEGLDAKKVYDGPSSYTFPKGKCQGANCTVHNVESGGYGPITLRQATAYSVNTVFAQLIEDVGIAKTAELANRLGLTMISPDGRGRTGPYGPSLTLGSADVSPLDMAAAYSVFADRGVQFPASPVLRVTAADGTVLEDNSARTGKRVLATAVADQVNDVLKDVVGYGTGVAANIGRPDGTAGKTGTSESFSDAWFVGYTPQLVTSVWMGDTNGRQPLVNIKGLPEVFGGTLPAQAWHDFMAAALAGSPVENFVPPAPLIPCFAPTTTTLPPYSPSSSTSSTSTSTSTTSTTSPLFPPPPSTSTTSTTATTPATVPCPPSAPPPTLKPLTPLPGTPTTTRLFPTTTRATTTTATSTTVAVP